MEERPELLKVNSLAALTGHPCKEPQAQIFSPHSKFAKKKNPAPFCRWAYDTCPSPEVAKRQELGKEPKCGRLHTEFFLSRTGPPSL